MDAIRRYAAVASGDAGDEDDGTGMRRCLRRARVGRYI